jgi:hypothetical protein
MNTFLLGVVALLLCLRLWPKRDWYVVETRVCYRNSLSQMILLSRGAFDEKDLSARKLKVYRESPRWLSLRSEDGITVGSIIQDVFEDLSAAQEYSRRPPMQRFITQTEYSDRIWVLRVVARTRRGALISPGAHSKAGYPVSELASVPAGTWHKSEA